MRDQEFIGYLKALADQEDRAALAVLRRGASPSSKYRIATYRYVAKWVGSSDRYWDEECLYLISALFARYPEARSTPGNFGDSVRLLRDAKGSDSIERRFIALVAADVQNVSSHLRYMVSLLRAENIPVNWLALLQDLRRWKSPAGRVERSWARQFWRFAPKSPKDLPPDQEITQHET